MKKNYLVILIAACILTGCISTTPASNMSTVAPKSAVEVRPGVYATNDVSNLPLPTSGYDIYVIGEIHGVHEIQLLFLDYLKMLHGTIGLRDVVLEASQARNKEMNEYVVGLSDEFHGVLLKGIKTFNETLPENEKIRVHAVDIDWTILEIHEHLCALKEEIGTVANQIQIPPLDEFEKWDEEYMLVLVNQIVEITDNESVLNELETLRASIRWYFADRLLNDDLPAQIREEAITRNIQYVLKELNGASVLVRYGEWHARKGSDSVPELYPWAQRLTEVGVSIYSVCIICLGGEVWDYGSEEAVSVSANPDGIMFADGTTLSNILENAPDYNIIYIDLNQEVYISTKLMRIRTSTGKTIFDGVIVFREVTPIQTE